MFLRVQLLAQHPFDPHGEASRGRVAGDHCSRIEQARTGKRCFYAASQFGLRGGNHACWNFFQPNFQ